MSPPNVCHRLRHPPSARTMPYGGSTPEMIHHPPSPLWLEVAQLAQEVEARLAAEAARPDDAEKSAAVEHVADVAEAAA